MKPLTVRTVVEREATPEDIAMRERGRAAERDGVKVPVRALTVRTLASGSKVAFSAPRAPAYCLAGGEIDPHVYTGQVGASLPETDSDWNVLDSWRITHEGAAALRFWAEVTS